MRRKHNIKLPNGFGSIQKLSGNRRKPWRARKTKGWEIIDQDEGKLKQTYINIGTFETYQEAYAALTKYNENPYDIEAERVTFEDVADKWLEMAARKYAPVTAAQTELTVKRIPKFFKAMKIKNIKMSDIERALMESAKSKAALSKMRVAIKHIMDFAERYDYIDKNYASLIDISTLVSEETRKVEREPLSIDEVQQILNSSGHVSEILQVAIFTGMRPSELVSIKKEHVNLEQWYICHGIKTAAGKNRIVPINKAIRHLIRRRMKESQSEYLFTMEDGKPWTYHKLLYKFRPLFPGHKLHDIRHTFITQWNAELHLDEIIGKLIVGHKIGTVTHDVYTHYNVEKLSAEMDKFYYGDANIALFKTS